MVDSKTASICRYEQVQRGSCRRGASCHFSHDLESKTTILATPTNTLPWRGHLAPAAPAFVPGLVSIAPCPEPEPLAKGAALKDTRSLITCTFYKKGRCTKGNDCLFLHEEWRKPYAPDECQAPRNAIREDEGPDIQLIGELTRQINGVSVKFGHGAKVEKLTLPQDISTVSLTGLSSSISPEIVTRLLRDFVDQLPDISVKLTATDAAPVALITNLEPRFAKRLCRALTPSKVERAGYPMLRAIIVPPVIQVGTSIQRVNRRTILCSWHKATRTVTLHYHSEDAASKVLQKFTSGLCELGGHRVQATVSRPCHNSRHEYQGTKLRWRVVLSNVLANISKADISRVLAISSSLRPVVIELGQPTYQIAAEVVAEDARKVLQRAGPLQDFSFEPNTTGKRFKAKAMYREDEDAISACTTLSETHLDIGPVKIFLELRATAKTKVLTEVYDILKNQLSTLMEAHGKVRFQFWRNTDSGHRFTVIKLSASDAEGLGPAKARVDALLEGSPAIVDGQKIWHDIYGKRHGLQLLQAIGDQTKVFIVRDNTTSTLRLFGSKTACINASKALAARAASMNIDEQEIKLDSRTFSTAMSGTYVRIQSFLGLKNVSLDIASKPKRIIIRGTAHDATFAHQMLDNGSSSRHEEGQNDCAICWSSPEKPVTIPCGHLYCADCFENMCSAISSGQEDCEIGCQGAAGKCKQILTLNGLQDNLTSTALESVLESSFRNYLRRRPHLYKSCPTRDCDQVYRTTLESFLDDPQVPDLPPTTLCLKCLNTVCLSCHACHGRMTCADYKDLSTGGNAATERLKKKLGIKDCPRCKTSIEKTEGCNHMRCSGCNIHICWVCLRTFEQSGATYEHMNQAHGGIGLDHLALD
jgi:hypothetical protein